MKKPAKTDLAKVNVMTDEEINYTESPPVTDKMFKSMRKYDPLKNVQVNLHVEIWCYILFLVLLYCAL